MKSLRKTSSFIYSIIRYRTKAQNRTAKTPRFQGFLGALGGKKSKMYSREFVFKNKEIAFMECNLFFYLFFFLHFFLRQFFRSRRLGHDLLAERNFQYLIHVLDRDDLQF